MKTQSKSKSKLKLILLVCMVFLFGSTVCVSAQDAALNKTKLTLNVGDTSTLEVMGSEAVPVWTSYNSNIAKVDAYGEVTALRTGKTTIKARTGSEYSTCAVTVVNASIKLNKSSATIYTGGTSTSTVTLKATVSGATKTVAWTSSNPEVATVENGKVTSVSAGNAVITASANGKSASCLITVKESSISLNTDSVYLSTNGTGSTTKLIPTIVGSSKSVKWTTSNKSVATVSSGTVTGKKTGTAIITATANGVSATCEVEVQKGSISIGSEKLTLYYKDDENPSAEKKQLKTNAGKKNVVVWSSSDENIAVVDEKGYVTAVCEGTVTITAECNGNADTCEVTVIRSVTDILEEEVTLQTKGSDTYTLNKEVIGRSSSVKWKSSNTKVVTVSSSGKLVAKKAGTATITATANGITDTVEVTVYNYDPTIKLSQSKYDLYTKKGNTLTLKATVNGPSKTVVWESSDPTVATVSTKGKVTAVGKGEAVITATANEVSAECVITVKESKVSLARTSITIPVGGKEVIPVDITGVSQSVTWTSTNTKIVTVKSGVITAKKNGKADIKVSANGITALCHVVVAECEHEYCESAYQEPTCTNLGYLTFTCELCGDSYTETMELLSHEYDGVVTDPTCTEMGYTTYTCVECGDSYVGDYVDAGHDWNEWEVTKAATCTEEGTKVRTCKNCTAAEEENMEIVEDAHVYETEVVPPTCTEKGYTIYTCVCGESYTSDEVAALGHDWNEWEVTKEATETEEGTKIRTCKNCTATENETIPVITHQHVYEAKVVPPTCTEEGYTVYLCSCGDSYASDKVAALGHDWNAWEVTKEATCTEKGAKTRSCKNCKKTDEETIPAGHIWGEWETTEEVTCEFDGERSRTCERCNTTQREDIPATGHQWDEKETVVEPTCIYQGFTRRFCLICNKYYGYNYVPALGHYWGEWKVTKEATETEEGTKTRTCVNCTATENETIPVVDHQHVYETEVVQPTCTEKGYTLHICACGDSYKTDYVDADGHNWNEWEITKEATETEEGAKTRTCKNCTATESETIPVVDHQHVYETEVVPPTCTEKGYTVYTCVCGESYTSDEVTALGHNWNEWEITKEATETEEGAKTRTCKNCTATESETIPVVDHQHVYQGKLVPPTCTEEGYTVYTCSCGDSYTSHKTDALGHYWGEWKVTKEANCTEKGTKTRTCARCTEKENDTIEVVKDAHVYETKVVQPTCTEAGYTLHQCTKCDYFTKTDETPALRPEEGHDWEEWEIVKEVTETEVGIKRRTCWYCNLVEQETIPAHAHNYKTVTCDPTCTEDGYIADVCEECGNETNIREISALDHYWKYTVIEKPTCTEDGYGLDVCARCGKIDYDSELPIKSLGHNGGDITVKPTCTEKGYTYTRCERPGCNYYEEYDYTDPKGHNYTEVVEEVTPTCTEDGYRILMCTNCQEGCDRCCSGTHHKCLAEKTVILPKTGHEYEKVVVAPTCQAKGYTMDKCIHDGCEDFHVIEGTETEIIDHKYEVKKVYAPTCTEEGYTYYRCTMCYSSYCSNRIAPLGHEKSSIIEVVEPTKPAAGYTEYHCDRCGVDFKADTTYYVPTEEQAYADIIALKEEYPEGTAWTDETFYDNENLGAHGEGCAAFALFASDAAFGAVTPERVHYDLSKIKVGDILIYKGPGSLNGHWVIVLEVKENSLIIAEGNVVYSGDIGRVHWGRELPFSDIWTLVEINTRYPEE